LIFPNGHHCHLGFLKLQKNLLAVLVRGGARCITVPNFLKIGQSIAKILRIFLFSNGGRSPSWVSLGHMLTTHREYLVVPIIVTNLVMIDAIFGAFGWKMENAYSRP